VRSKGISPQGWSLYLNTRQMMCNNTMHALHQRVSPVDEQLCSSHVRTSIAGKEDVDLAFCISTNIVPYSHRCDLPLSTPKVAPLVWQVLAAAIFPSALGLARIPLPAHQRLYSSTITEEVLTQSIKITRRNTIHPREINPLHRQTPRKMSSRGFRRIVARLSLRDIANHRAH
jgi:hypothetical protein